MPMFSFDNSYARLHESCFVRLSPTPVSKPGWMAFNGALARELGLDPEELQGEAGLAVFAGNRVPEGSEPLAQAYAGHQFGHFVPQLGDGRAVLLGELVDPNGRRHDLQLKGCGPTPFSRAGDGRAWVGPVLREFLVGEAMAALGVPTTRALAAVTTGDLVYREQALPGAVLTRVAASHLRVGTFQFFAARGDVETLRSLVNYACSRHHPGAHGALGLIEAVARAQAELVAAWMSVGFVHGVLNTDNTTISGETIDYGPCAFLDDYRPDQVYSSIDVRGRYAYGNQPRVLLWNLAQLATALLPLIDSAPERAAEQAHAALDRFSGFYEGAWLRRFRAKLGLREEHAGDQELIEALLTAMADGAADFTRTFRGLADGTATAEFQHPDAFHAFEQAWLARLEREGQTLESVRKPLQAVNPALHPRNHRVEEVIAAAVEGDLEPFRRLHRALWTPFKLDAGDAELALAPREDQQVHATFCGT